MGAVGKPSSKEHYWGADFSSNGKEELSNHLRLICEHQRERGHVSGQWGFVLLSPGVKMMGAHMGALQLNLILVLTGFANKSLSKFPIHFEAQSLRNVLSSYSLLL